MLLSGLERSVLASTQRSSEPGLRGELPATSAEVFLLWQLIFS
jgi:hypothetical protein